MGAPWKGPDRIPNSPVREAFLSSHLTASEVCRAVGWFRKKSATGGGTADTTLLKRVLGLHPTCNRNREGKVYYSIYSTISITNAQLICGALGLDFDALYEDLPATRALGGVCECGERMLRPAERCGWCEEEARLGLVGGSRHGLERAA